MYPANFSEDQLKTTIGGALVTQPYDAALLNVSAMSYGALSDNAILALSRCAEDEKKKKRNRRNVNKEIWRREIKY